MPTFTKDVAPIIFNNCATCHRAGEVAPMTFLSYEDVRPWAKVIKTKVQAREMPPWGADPDHSLKMRNDRSLSKQQIDTIVAWVDGGAPKGNDADLPALPKFADGWTYGREPDYILEMPIEFTIPAEGELGVQMFYSKVPFKEDRFAEVLEIRPGNRAVVHHAGVFVVDIPEGASIDAQGRLIAPDGKPATDRGEGLAGRADTTALPGANKLLSWVPGRGVDAHRADIGKRIPAGKYINWQVHYNPIGKESTDRTRLGIWFNKVPVTHEVLIRQAGDALATTKGGLSLYRAEGKEVEYTAEEGSTRRRSKTPNIPAVRRELEAHGHHAGHRRHHALRDVSAHASARQEPEVGGRVSRRPRADDSRRAEVRLQLADSVRARRAAEDSGRQQDSRHRRLRQLAEEPLESVAEPRSVLVGAELGRDVPALH